MFYLKYVMSVLVCVSAIAHGGEGNGGVGGGGDGLVLSSEQLCTPAPGQSEDPTCDSKTHGRFALKGLEVLAESGGVAPGQSRTYDLFSCDPEDRFARLERAQIKRYPLACKFVRTAIINERLTLPAGLYFVFYAYSSAAVRVFPGRDNAILMSPIRLPISGDESYQELELSVLDSGRLMDTVVWTGQFSARNLGLDRTDVDSIHREFDLYMHWCEKNWRQGVPGSFLEKFCRYMEEKDPFTAFVAQHLGITYVESRPFLLVRSSKDQEPTLLSMTVHLPSGIWRSGDVLAVLPGTYSVRFVNAEGEHKEIHGIEIPHRSCFAAPGNDCVGFIPPRKWPETKVGSRQGKLVLEGLEEYRSTGGVAKGQGTEYDLFRCETDSGSPLPLSIRKYPLACQHHLGTHRMNEVISLPTGTYLLMYGFWSVPVRVVEGKTETLHMRELRIPEDPLRRPLYSAEVFLYVQDLDTYLQMVILTGRFASNANSPWQDPGAISVDRSNEYSIKSAESSLLSFINRCKGELEESLNVSSDCRYLLTDDPFETFRRDFFDSEIDSYKAIRIKFMIPSSYKMHEVGLFGKGHRDWLPVEKPLAVLPGMYRLSIQRGRDRIVRESTFESYSGVVVE